MLRLNIMYFIFASQAKNISAMVIVMHFVSSIFYSHPTLSGFHLFPTDWWLYIDRVFKDILCTLVSSDQFHLLTTGIT